ncbi:MAG TPA: DNA alkylation repair protein [Chitinophagaceae bacterium]|nr:DNA alkylation repair protein [Chitinophagaceae bacterium]
MSSLLKDLYSPSFYDKFSTIVANVLPSFNKQQFKKAIFDKDWETRELKSRMKHTSAVLHRFFPGNFEQSTTIIEKIVEALRQHNMTRHSLEFMFFPDYIETYGIDHFNAATRAFESLTQFTSCEFAVRPFIIRYGQQMINKMTAWSKHENHHVRRLASEGCRPRLPWAMAIPALKKDPTPILPILNNLKNDPSEYVRRSVANNLNDIAKDNPQIVLKIAKEWKGSSKETDAIIKHGCRTLLKQGHPEILKYYGLHNSDHFKMSAFRIATPRVKTGDKLEFSFVLHNLAGKTQTARLEYGMYYRKKNGEYAKKVFKISERPVAPNEKLAISRKQSFKPITTRTFYPGVHKLSIIINGQERKTGTFELVELLHH